MPFLSRSPFFVPTVFRDLSLRRSFPISRERRKTFCLREGNSSETVRFRILFRGFFSWWLLAPNTPRQDRRPCTHRRNLKFRLPIFFRHLPGKGQTEWFALCTPCSFFSRGNVDSPKRMRGSRGKTFGWPPGRQVSKHSQEQKLNFCDGCRAFGPAEGCWGREATNHPRNRNRETAPRRYEPLTPKMGQAF